MKRINIIAILLLLFCSLPGYSQFWIEFGWHEPHCRQCLQMSQNLRLTPKQSKDYQHVLHKFGQKIEKETRKNYKHWDKAARKIYDLRMDRDHKIQRILSPNQFALYIRYSQDRPQRIHDYRGWYKNPKYAGYHYSPNWRRLEDQYWTYHWNLSSGPRQNHHILHPSPHKQKAPMHKPQKNNKNKKDNHKQSNRDNNRRR